MSAKSAYLYLLSVNFVPLHCEEKFLSLFGSLYWPTTWRQLSFCPLDRPVIDVAWQVFFTPLIVWYLLGMTTTLTVFVAL